MAERIAQVAELIMGQSPPSSAYNEAGDGAFILPELMTPL